MSKLLIPEKEKFKQYKGFTYTIIAEDENLDYYLGTATSNPEEGKGRATLSSRGRSRREAEAEMRNFIDLYRKSEKQSSLIITTGN